MKYSKRYCIKLTKIYGQIIYNNLIITFILFCVAQIQEFVGDIF